MKTATILALLLGAFLLFQATRAECVGCIWTGSCYDDGICGYGCVCVKTDYTDVSGICMVG